MILIINAIFSYLSNMNATRLWHLQTTNLYLVKSTEMCTFPQFSNVIVLFKNLYFLNWTLLSFIWCALLIHEHILTPKSSTDKESKHISSRKEYPIIPNYLCNLFAIFKKCILILSRAFIDVFGFHILFIHGF